MLPKPVRAGLVLCAVGLPLAAAPASSAAAPKPLGQQATRALQQSEKLTRTTAVRRTYVFLAAGMSQNARCLRGTLRAPVKGAGDKRAAALARTALLGRSARVKAARILLTSRVAWPIRAYEDGRRAAGAQGSTGPCAIARELARNAFWLRYFVEVQRARKTKGGTLFLRYTTRKETLRRGRGTVCVQRTFIAARPGSAKLRDDALKSRTRWTWRPDAAGACASVVARQLSGGGLAAPGAAPRPAAVPGGGVAGNPLDWQGRLTPHGRDGKADGRPPYDTRVTLSESGSVLTGASNYPGARCGGVLTFVRRDATSFVFTEKLTYGTDFCIDNGVVTLIVNDDGVAYQWTRDGVSRDRGPLKTVVG
jgi:hypothetical protein